VLYTSDILNRLYT